MDKKFYERKINWILLNFRPKLRSFSTTFSRLHDSPAVIEKRGTFEKVFVREFAKLRWGVFDEVPLKQSGKDSEFYVDPDMPPSKSLTPIKDRNF